MPRKPNFMIVITDQQSGHPYWPEGWEEKNLPAMRWLRENGISFDRAYTNSCTCSPARVTMLTGLYPAQHGVKNIISCGSPAELAERREVTLSTRVPNLAKVMSDAGYHVVLADDGFDGLVVVEINTRKCLDRAEREADLAEALAFTRLNLVAPAWPE